MKKLILTGIWLLCGFLLPAQELEQNVEERLQTFFREYTTHTANIGTCKLDSFRIDFRKKKLLVYTNERFAYQPLRPETVDAIYRHLGQILPGPVNYFDLTVFADGKSIEELIPNLYRKGKKDKARLVQPPGIQRYPLGNPYLAPLRHHPPDWKDATSPFGKATGNIISMTRTNGDGNARGCSALQKTSSPNPSSCPTSCPC